MAEPHVEQSSLEDDRGPRSRSTSADSSGETNGSPTDQTQYSAPDFNTLNDTYSESCGEKFDKPQSKPSINIRTTNGSSISSRSPASTYLSSWKKRAFSIDSVNRVISAVAQNYVEPFDHSGKVPEQTRPWLATWIRFGPLSGIFCMFLAAASIVASLGILAGSDKQPVGGWSSPPSTYLAIFTAIANISMRYAAIQGIVIAWW